MKKAVFGLVTSQDQARKIVDDLLASGFANQDISILSPSSTDSEREHFKDNSLNTRSNSHKEIDGEFNRDNVHGDTTHNTTRGDVTRSDTTRDASTRKETAFEDNAHRGKLTSEKHTKAPEGAATGATAGGLLGGSLGLLAGIGALAIPGVGPFIAAGPIMAALSGSALGGGLGLALGAAIGLSIPEFELKKYEAGLKAGNILISVHTERDEDLTRATEILKRDGAKDISTTNEKTKSSY